MKDRLGYIGAFACGLCVAAALYYFAFRLVMSGAMTPSVVGFVGMVIIMPMMAGLVVFGVIYPRLSGVVLTGSDRLVAFAFTLITTIFFTSLLLARVLEQQLVMLVFLATLFVGGRILLQRKPHG